MNNFVIQLIKGTKEGKPTGSLDSIAARMNTFNRELCVNISCNDSVSMSFIRCVNVVLIKNKISNVILSRIDGTTFSLNNSSVNQIIIRIDDDENIFIDDQIEANKSRFEIVLIEKLKKDKQSEVVLIHSRSTSPDKYLQVFKLISNICDTVKVERRPLVVELACDF